MNIWFALLQVFFSFIIGVAFGRNHASFIWPMGASIVALVLLQVTYFLSLR